MQCMMKEICAQCLQRHLDPETGEEKVVFSCFNQDQRLEMGWILTACTTGWARTACRRKLTALWIDRSLKQLHLRQAAE